MLAGMGYRNCYRLEYHGILWGFWRNDRGCGIESNLASMPSIARSDTGDVFRGHNTSNNPWLLFGSERQARARITNPSDLLESNMIWELRRGISKRMGQRSTRDGGKIAARFWCRYVILLRPLTTPIIG